jgi:hypothetical protein
VCFGTHIRVTCRLYPVVRKRGNDGCRTVLGSVVLEILSKSALYIRSTTYMVTIVAEITRLHSFVEATQFLWYLATHS